MQLNYGQSNTLLFNISYANRAPNPVELFSDGLHHSAAIIELGDIRFEQEKALKLSLSSIHKNLFKKGDNLSISPHLSNINDFILIEPTTLDLTTRGAFPVWEYRQTDALLMGIDMDYTINITEG